MADSPQQLKLFTPDLPDYRIRVSPRARHVSIRVLLHGPVEVVLPKGFDQSLVPEIVERRREWIARAVSRLAAQQQDLAPDHFAERPSTIEVRSRAETWQVSYLSGPEPLTLVQTAPLSLTLDGDTGNPQDCGELLRRWLARKARAELAPWLRQLSFELDLPFNRISVRGQRTRWASCSNRGNISLNYKLLFLPADLVHYVLVHELCHTIHMDHSPNFWQLVEQKLPDCDRWRDALRDGWRYVPRWVEKD